MLKFVKGFLWRSQEGKYGTKAKLPAATTEPVELKWETSAARESRKEKEMKMARLLMKL